MRPKPIRWSHDCPRWCIRAFWGPSSKFGSGLSIHCPHGRAQPSSTSLIHPSRVLGQHPSVRIRWTTWTMDVFRGPLAEPSSTDLWIAGNTFKFIHHWSAEKSHPGGTGGALALSMSFGSFYPCEGWGYFCILEFPSTFIRISQWPGWHPSHGSGFPQPSLQVPGLNCHWAIPTH